MGILEPDFPEITAAQKAWQDNYLAMVAAQEAGITPSFSANDYVNVIDRTTGLPFLPSVGQFGGGGGGVASIVAGSNVTVDDTDPANPIVSASGGGGGSSVTPIIVTNAWNKIDENDRVIVDAELANTYLLVATTKPITFVFSYLVWEVGESMKITLNASFGAGAQALFAGDGSGTASLIGPSSIVPVGTTAEITCFNRGVLEAEAATYIVAAYSPD